jgi:aspartate/methionine/tyrosine aminotransferase
MKLQVANRLNGIGEYYFSQKLREIEAMNKEGAAVINLGIGSPDLAPDSEVIGTVAGGKQQAECTCLSKL